MAIDPAKKSHLEGLWSGLPSSGYPKGSPAWSAALMREGTDLLKRPEKTAAFIPPPPSIPPPPLGDFSADRFAKVSTATHVARSSSSKWPRLFQPHWWAEDTPLAYGTMLGEAMVERRLMHVGGALAIAMLAVYIIVMEPSMLAVVHEPLASLAGKGGANWVIAGCSSVLGWLGTIVLGRIIGWGVTATSFLLGWSLRVVLVGGILYALLLIGMRLGWLPQMNIKPF